MVLRTMDRLKLRTAEAGGDSKADEWGSVSSKGTTWGVQLAEICLRLHEVRVVQQTGRRSTGALQ